MSYELVENNGLKFRVDNSIYLYDSHTHWLEMVAWAIRELDQKITGDDKKRIDIWTVSHRKYGKNNKLDFNYANFSSNIGTFEVIREYTERYGYSEPIITNVC
jgi:hypothetical protein